jgi:hypothetical protein
MAGIKGFWQPTIHGALRPDADGRSPAGGDQQRRS